jgi:CheY-like chemotaxis protein
VLIADESTHAQKFVLDLCRFLGVVEMASAPSRELALSKLEQAPWDIFICTWGRNIDAPQLTQHIRSDNSKPYQRVRIIVLRAGATVADVMAVRDSGADEFLAMPLSQGTLLSALNRVATTPQHFVETDVYKGPCRRRRRLAWEGERRNIEAAERRSKQSGEGAP